MQNKTNKQKADPYFPIFGSVGKGQTNIFFFKPYEAIVVVECTKNHVTYG